MSGHRDAAAAPPAGVRDEEDAVPAATAGVHWQEEEEEEEEGEEAMSAVKVGELLLCMLHVAWPPTLIETIVVISRPHKRESYQTAKS